MPTIDEKVVSMKFDNQQFEKGVQQSMSTLEKLKQSLKFDKVADSVKVMQNSLTNIDLSGLEKNVESISEKFTLLGNIGQSIMKKIGDEAAEAATKIFNMVSGINNIKAGEAKYQTRTKAVQTITNATGKTVAEVEKILDRLQKYTDDTSADFTEMVNSIGKFTSVGIELSVAEKAMEGISNEAYKSGASRMEAGRAMYNFAQALSSGAVKLIDWKSIENANMATKEFKEELIKTAIELGTIEKKTETTGKIMKQTKKATKTAAAEFKETEINYKSFNQTLSEGWLTSDVLIKTLNRYADTNTEIGKSAFAAAKEYLTFGDVVDTIADTVSSGWMRTWQAIFGNLDEARKLWTRVGDSIVDLYSVFSEYRVSLVESWHELGGYTAAIDAASNIWHTFANIVLGVKEAFEQIIPPMTAERLVTITEKIRDVSAKLRKMFGLYQESEEEIEETTKDSAKATATTKKTTEQAKKLAGETKTISKNLEEIRTGLKNGSVSDDVKKLQKQLNKLGITSNKLAVDGIFGKKTQEAIKALQKELGVAQTGIWDETTKAAATANSELLGVKNTAESSTIDLSKTLGLGSRGNAVKNLQKQLNKFGVQADKLIADGVFGPKTQAAVKALQKDLGVNQTGTWDKATIEAVSTSEKYSDTATTISTSAEKATEKTKEAVEETSPLMERLQNIVRGWASAIGISFELLKSLGVTIKNIAKMFIPLINVGLRFISMLAEMVQNLNNNLKQGNKYSQLTKSISEFFKPLGDLIENIAKYIDRFISIYAQFLKVTGNINTFGSFFTFLEMYIRKNTPFGFIFDLANAAIAGIIKIRDTIKKVVEFASEKISIIGKELGSVKSLDQFLYLIESHLQNLPVIGKLIKDFDGKGLIKLKNVLISFVVSVVSAFQNKSLKPLLLFFRALKESFKNAIKGTPIETIIKFIETKSKIVKNILLTLAATVVKVVRIIGSAVKKFIDTWGWISNLDEVLFMIEYFLSKIPLIGVLFRNADGSFNGNTLINIKNSIVTFVTGIIKVFRDGDFSVIKNFFSMLWGSFKEAVSNSPFASFLRGVMEFGERIIAVLIKMASMIGSIVGSAVKRVKVFVSNWDWISGFDELLFVIEYFLSRLPIVGSLFRDAEGSFNGDILINIKNKISEFVRGVTDTFRAGDTSSITNFITNLYDNLKEAAKTNPFIDYLLSIGELIKEVITAIDSLVSSIVSGGKASANRLSKSGVGSLLDNLIIMFTHFNRFVTSVIRDLNQSGTLSAIGNVIVSIFRLVSVLGEMIFNEINNILGIASGTEVKSGLQGFLEKVAIFARGFANAINIFVNSYERFLSETGKTNIFSSFFEFLTQYFSESTGVIGSLISKILPIVEGFVASLKNVVNSIKESFSKKDINSISDFFGALWDGLKNSIPLIAKIAEIAGPILSAIGKTIVDFLTKVSDAFKGKDITNFGDFFSTLFEGLHNAMPIETIVKTIGEKIVSVLYSTVEWIAGKVEELLISISSSFNEKNPFGSIIDGIVSFFSGVPKKAEEMKDTVTNAVDSLTKVPGNIVGSIKENTGNTFDNIGKMIQKIWNRFLLTALGLSFPALIAAITATAYNFSSAMQMFAKSFLADKIKKTGVKFDTLGDTALKIVGAIAVLSVVFWRLGKMSPEDTSKSIKGFSIVVGSFGTLCILLTGLQKYFGGLGNMGTQMLAFAGSVAAFAAGLFLMIRVWKYGTSNGNLPHMISSIIMMIGILSAFAALQVKLVEVAAKNGGKAEVKINAIFDMCKGIALIALAFGALVFILSQAYGIGENGKEGEKIVNTAIGIMITLVTELGVLTGTLAYFASKSPKGAVIANIKGLLPLAGSMLMLVLALGEVALAIYYLGPGAVWQAFAIIEIILGSLAATLLLFTKLTKGENPKDVKKRVGALTLSMVAMVISLGLVALEIALLSTQLQSVPMGNLITEIAGLLTIISAMGAISILFQKYGGGNKDAYAKVGALALSMVSMALAVGIVAYSLAQAAQMLRLVPLEQMITYVAGVLLIIASMGAIAILMQKFGNKGVDAILNATGLAIAMVGMAVALGIVATVMSEAVKNIQNVSWDKILSFMGAMIGILWTMIGAVAILQNVSIGSFVKVAAGLAALLVGIGLGIAIFGALVTSTINLASEALWLWGSRMSQFSNMIETVNWEPINKLYTFFTQDIIIIWNMIKGIDFNSFNDKIEKLTHIAGLLAVFSENVTAITDETEAAASRIPSLMSSVSEAMTVAKDISIPEFVSDGSLTELGASISNYGNQIASTTATDESSEFAKRLANDAVEIANSVAGITDPDKVESTLTNLGSAINMYYGMLNDIVTDEDGNVQIPTVDSQMISQAFNALTEAVPSDKIDMLSSYAEGSDNDMTKVALGINALGKALGSYANDIGGLETAPVDKANDVLEEFSKLNGSINPKNIFGQLEDTSNQKSFSDFADDIKALGGALGTYAKDIGGIKKDDVENANTALEQFMKLEKQLHQENNDFKWTNLFKIFQGEQINLTTFSGQITNISGALKIYAEDIGSLKDVPIDEANGVISDILGVSTSLKNIGPTGGALSWLFGDTSLSKFATNMGDLGSGVAQFAMALKDESLNDSNMDNVTQATTFIKDLIENMGKIESTSLFGKLFTGEKSFENVAKGLGKLGEEIGTFYGWTNEVDYDKMPDVFQIIERILGWTNILQKDAITVFDNDAGFGGYGANVDIFTYISEKIPKVLASIVDLDRVIDEDGTTLLESLKEFGKKITEAIMQGISNPGKTSDAESAVNTVMNMVKTKIESFYTNFYNAGKYVVQGFVDGLNDKEMLNKLIAAGIVVGVTPTEATQKEVKVQSPSKKFEWIGKMCVLGFKDGFLNNTGLLNYIPSNTLSYMLGEFNRYSSVGAFFGDGLVNGINKGESDVVNAMTSMLSNVYDEAKNTLGVHSPSIKAEDLMENFDKGAALGLYENAYLLSDSMKKTLTDKFLEEYESGLQNAVTLSQDYGYGIVESFGESVNKGVQKSQIESSVLSLLPRYQSYKPQDVINFIGKAISQIQETAGNVINSIHINDNPKSKYWYLEQLFDADEIKNFINGVKDKAKYFIYESINDIKDELTINNIINGFVNDISSKNNTGKQLVNAVTPVIDKVKKYVGNGIIDFGNGWKDLFDMIGNVISADGNVSFDFGKMIQNGITNLKNVAGSVFESIGNAFDNIKISESTYNSASSMVIDVLRKTLFTDENISNVMRKAESIKNTITTIATDIFGNIKESISLDNIIPHFSMDDLMPEKLKNAVKIFNSIKDSIFTDENVAAITGKINTVKQSIGDFTGNVIDWFNALPDNVSNAVTNFVPSIESFGDTLRNGFYSIFSNIVKGLVNGVNDNKSDVSASVINLMLDNVLNPAQKVVEVRSPSRKFEWIGHMCALGLKNGFEKYGYLVTDSTLDLASSSLEAIMATYDATKLGDVSQAAIETISGSFLKSQKAMSDQEKQMFKDMLVAAGYLNEADRKSNAKVIDAIKRFKKEVVYDKDYKGEITGDWTETDAKILKAVLQNQFKNDAYDELEYQKELINEVGNEYEKTGNKAEKSQNKQLKGYEALATLNKGLKLGMVGDDVKTLQQALNELTDAGLTVNGVFNDKTFDALRKLQKILGLNQTGEWDESTFTYSYYNSKEVDKNTATLEKQQENIEEVAKITRVATTEAEKTMDKLTKKYGDADKAFSAAYDVLSKKAPEVYTKEDLEVLKDILVAAGLLSKKNRNNDSAVGSALFKLKTGMLKDYYVGQIIDHTWDETDSGKLLDALYGGMSPEDRKRREDRIKEESKEIHKSDPDINKLKKEMNEIYAEGNVELSKRPIVTAKKMMEAGWKDFKGTYATLYSSTFTDSIGDKHLALDVTPILPDGKVLSPKSLEDYTNYLIKEELKGSGRALDADKIENGGLGILLRVKETKGTLDEAIEDSEKWTNGLHEYQAKIYDSKEKLARIQRILEQHGYLKAESYIPGQSNIATQVAIKDFKKEILGVSNPHGSWSDEDANHLEDYVMHYGDIDKLFEARIGSTKKSNKYLKGIDKKIEEEIEKQNKHTKGITKIQKMLVKYGYLKKDDYKSGTYDKNTEEAFTRFNKQIFGITDKSKILEQTYTEENDTLQDNIDEQVKKYGSLDNAVEKRSDTETKAQAVENKIVKEDVKNSKTENGVSSLVKKKYEHQQNESAQFLKHNMTKGDTKDVRELQIKLNQKGYLDTDKITGIYDDDTVEAIKKLQEAIDRTPTGEWDLGTRTHVLNTDVLGEVYDYYETELSNIFTKELKRGSTGNVVKNLQKRLINHGYLAKGEDDGVYGSKTAEAVRKLQQAIGVSETGNWDWNTINKTKDTKALGNIYVRNGNITYASGAVVDKASTKGMTDEEKREYQKNLMMYDPKKDATSAANAINFGEWMDGITENLNPSSLLGGLTGDDATKQLNGILDNFMGDPNDTDGSGGGLFGGIFNKLKEGATNLPEVLTGMLDLPTDNMLEVFNAGDSAGGSFLEGILTKIKSGVGGIGSGLLGLFGIGEGGEGVSNEAISGALSTASDALGGDFLGNLGDTIKNGASNLGGSLLSLFGLGEDGTISNEAISGALTTAGGALGSGLLGAIASKIGEGGSKIIEAILSALGLNPKDTKNVEAVVNAAADAIGKSTNESGSSTSSVRPVVDADTYANTTALKFNEQFGKEGSPIFKMNTSLANVHTIAGQIQSSVDTMDTNMKTKLDTLAAKFDGLNTHMDNIHKDIANMKIVLDSDRLVVGTVDSMDRALGRKRFIAGGFRNTNT